MEEETLEILFSGKDHLPFFGKKIIFRFVLLLFSSRI